MNLSFLLLSQLSGVREKKKKRDSRCRFFCFPPNRVGISSIVISWRWLSGPKDGEVVDDYYFRDSFDHSSSESQLQDVVGKTGLPPSHRSSRSQTPQPGLRSKPGGSKTSLQTTGLAPGTIVPLPPPPRSTETMVESSVSSRKFNLFQVRSFIVLKKLLKVIKFLQNLFLGFCAVVPLRSDIVDSRYGFGFGVGFGSFEQREKDAGNDRSQKGVLRTCQRIFGKTNFSTFI